MLITLGRLEAALVHWRHSAPKWDAWRDTSSVNSIVDFHARAGRWEAIVSWLPSKRERERARVEWLAKVKAEMDAKRLARARTSWPDRRMP